MKVAAIITAGGIGKRMGAGKPKQYLEVRGAPIIVHTLRRFAAIDEIDDVVVTVPPDDVSSFAGEILESHRLPVSWLVVAGGDHRQQSVWNGLAAVGDDADIVVIHDAVRPFVTRETVMQSIAAAAECGAAVVAAPLKETVKRVHDDRTVMETVDRARLWGAQTPQTFRLDVIRAAHEHARGSDFIGTDDAMLVERLGKPVGVVEGDYRNIKITTPDDIAIAEAIITSQAEHQAAASDSCAGAAAPCSESLTAARRKT